MSDQELLETFIQDRIGMLLADYKKSRSEGPAVDSSHAEAIIDSLPEKDKELVENYINRIIDDLGAHEPFLYKQGFLDGIKVMREMIRL